jgi:hypothetical protein
MWILPDKRETPQCLGRHCGAENTKFECLVETVKGFLEIALHRTAM